MTKARSNATAEAAKGDLRVGNGTNLSGILAVGSNGDTIVADSSTPTGLKWAAPATGMTNPMTTTGDIIYSSSGSTPARRGIGSTGQVLTVSGGVPTWATPAGGGGKVLQVVNATTSTQTVNSTSTYADTTLTATITPTLSTSKILVLVSQSGVGKNNNEAATLRLLRGATELIVFEKVAGFTNTTITSAIGSSSTTYLDAPATTSATTYKTQFKSFGTASVFVQNDGGTSTITLMEIGA